MGCKRYFQGLAVFAALLLVVYRLSAPVAHAQTGRCFWENPCTPTATASPTLIPGASTPTSTPTPPPGATATATSQINPKDFKAPEYGMPTSIPAVNLQQDYPAPTPVELTPIPAPSAVSLSMNTPQPFTPMPITSTITISLTVTPAALLTSTNSISGPVAFTQTIRSVNDFTDGVISYTHSVTGQAAALRGTAAITIQTAPAWYAPDLPRPFANVGWTFEQITDPTAPVGNYTFESWSALGGYIISLPFSFARSIWLLFSDFGPFGLFLGWLFVMGLFTFVIQTTIILLRMALLGVKVIVRLVEVLGGWIPTGG